MTVTRRHPSPWNVTMTRSALVLAIALVACAAQPATAPAPVHSERTTVALPPVPDSVPSALGYVTVVWMDTLKNEQDRTLMGGYRPGERTIYLSRSVIGTNRKVAQLVLAHERCHVTLVDAGIRQLIPDQIADAICDAMATGYVIDMLQRAK